MQRFAQQKDCETTHDTLCNSPATCLGFALADKLLRKLHSVTGPLECQVLKIDKHVIQNRNMRQQKAKETHSKVCYAKQNDNSWATANFSVASFNNGYDRRNYARKCCTCGAILDRPEEPAVV